MKVFSIPQILNSSVPQFLSSLVFTECLKIVDNFFEKNRKKVVESGKKCTNFTSRKNDLRMNYPIGEYYCKLDSKGRLLLPSSFKEQLGDVIEEGFVLRPSLFGDCLELFGMSDWRAMQEKLGRLNPFKAENVMLIRRFNAGARMVKVDANGRLQIPKDLMEKTCLVKEVVMTSLIDRMQIWDRSMKEIEDSKISEKEFAEMLTAKLGDCDFIG